MAAFEYHVAKPLRLDLEGEGLVTVQPGERVFSEDEVAPWGRSVDALVDQGRLVRMPKQVTAPAEFTDEELLAEIEARGLHIAMLEQTVEPETAADFTIVRRLIAAGKIVQDGDGWKLAGPADPADGQPEVQTEAQSEAPAETTPKAPAAKKPAAKRTSSKKE